MKIVFELASDIKLDDGGGQESGIGTVFWPS